MPVKLGDIIMRWHAHKPSGKVTEVDEQWLKGMFEKAFSDFFDSIYGDENVNVRLPVPQGSILKMVKTIS